VAQEREEGGRGTAKNISLFRSRQAEKKEKEKKNSFRAWRAGDAGMLHCQQGREAIILF
jgi:hypothetical protein